MSKDVVEVVLSLPLLHPTRSDAEEGGTTNHLSKYLRRLVPSQTFRERTHCPISNGNLT